MTALATHPIDAADASPCTMRYRRVRDSPKRSPRRSPPEDQVIQSMPDVSPTKWHRGAHHLVLRDLPARARASPATTPSIPTYAYLFNSYYETVGPRHPRPQRGLLSRPIGRRESRATGRTSTPRWTSSSTSATSTGPTSPHSSSSALHHEQQHQELLLMDIKHVLLVQPDRSGLRRRRRARSRTMLGRMRVRRRRRRPRRDRPRRTTGFAFDNESPRHKVYLEPFRIADRLVTRGRVARVHRRRRLPPAGALALRRLVRGAGARVGRTAVLARRRRRRLVVLHARRPPRRSIPSEPVVHVSHYEADAFARWRGARLPTEFEWEHARRVGPTTASRRPHRAAPAAAPTGRRRRSATSGSGPRARTCPIRASSPRAGAVGEYNGKFMSGQMMLRGGACVTPAGHARVDLPQLLSARQSLDVRGRTPRGGQLVTTDSEETRVAERPARRRRVSTYTSPPTTSRTRCASTPTGPALDPRTSRRSGSTTTAASQLFDEITRLPEYYPTRCERAILVERAHEIAQRDRRRHARRARIGNVGEDADPARRAARRGHDHALRAVRRERADVARRGRRGRAGVPGASTCTRSSATSTLTSARSRAAAGGSSRSSAGRSATSLPRRAGRVPARGRRRARSRRLLPARSRPRQGRRSPRSRVRRRAGRHRRVQQERARGDEPRARRRLRRRRASSTSRCSSTRRERIEMRLRSTDAHTVQVRALELDVPFAAGEEMRTEVSAKFTREQVADELADAGHAASLEWWTDPDGDFALVAGPAQADPRYRRRRAGGSGHDREAVGHLEHAHDLAVHLDREVTAHDRDVVEPQRADPVGDRRREVQLGVADVGLEAQHRAQEQQRRRRRPRLRRARRRDSSPGSSRRVAVDAREQLGQAGRRTTVTRRRARASPGAPRRRSRNASAPRRRSRCRAATRCRSDTRSGCSRRSSVESVRTPHPLNMPLRQRACAPRAAPSPRRRCPSRGSGPCSSRRRRCAACRGRVPSRSSRRRRSRPRSRR